MLNHCIIKINNLDYKGTIKTGSSNSAFEKIKLTINGDPVLIEESLINFKRVEVLFREEKWIFGFNSFKICHFENFEFEFEPNLISRKN